MSGFFFPIYQQKWSRLKNEKYKTCFHYSFIFVFFCLSPPKKIKDLNLDQYFSAEQFKNDFKYFYRTLENNHPSLHDFSAKQKFDMLSDSISASIDQPLTLKDSYVLFSRIAGQLKCGHTLVMFPENVWHNIHRHFKFFPLQLSYDNKRAFVIKNQSSNDSIIAGNEILSINQEPIERIICRFLQTLSADGDNLTFKYANMNYIKFGLFSGYSEFPDSFIVQFRTWPLTAVKQTTVAAKLFDHSPYLRWEGYEISDSGRPFTAEFLDSFNTAVITIRSFMLEPKTNFSIFLKSTFTTIEQKQIQNLVLDLRDNDGGPPEPAAELFSYLMSTDYIYFKSFVHGYHNLKYPNPPRMPNFTGKLYVLINGGCFSTTGHLLSLVKHYQLGVLNGILPDIEFKPTVADIIDSKDSMKDFILMLIRKNSAPK